MLSSQPYSPPGPLCPQTLYSGMFRSGCFWVLQICSYHSFHHSLPPTPTDTYPVFLCFLCSSKSYQIFKSQFRSTSSRKPLQFIPAISPGFLALTDSSFNLTHHSSYIEISFHRYVLPHKVIRELLEISDILFPAQCLVLGTNSLNSCQL